MITITEKCNQLQSIMIVIIVTPWPGRGHNTPGKLKKHPISNQIPFLLIYGLGDTRE